MKRLVILATEYSNSKEADEIFAQAGWKKVSDQSVTHPKKKLVKREQHSTPLIDLDIEEYEYGEE